MEARHTHALHTRGHTVFSMLFSMSGETILPSTILHYRHLALLLYPSYAVSHTMLHYWHSFLQSSSIPAGWATPHLQTSSWSCPCCTSPTTP